MWRVVAYKNRRATQVRSYAIFVNHKNLVRAKVIIAGKNE